MNDWSWPQIIVACYLGLAGLSGLLFHGEDRKPLNGVQIIFESATVALLLGWGGFWK